jgi:hypothetical protein
MSKKKGQHIREDLKVQRNLSFAWNTSNANACRTIEALHQDMPMPVGTIWYRLSTEHSIDILDCYVTEYLRRCGVMTLMFQKLRAAYPSHPHVVTGSGTRFGKPWLIRMGFSQHPLGHWFLHGNLPLAK